MRTVMEENEVACCVRGYHVYKTVWAAAVGEVLICRREPTNSADRYAVAVLKDRGNDYWTLTAEDVKSLFSVLEKRRLHTL